MLQTCHKADTAIGDTRRGLTDRNTKITPQATAGSVVVRVTELEADTASHGKSRQVEIYGSKFVDGRNERKAPIEWKGSLKKSDLESPFRRSKGFRNWPATANRFWNFADPFRRLRLSLTLPSSPFASAPLADMRLPNSLVASSIWWRAALLAGILSSGMRIMMLREGTHTKSWAALGLLAQSGCNVDLIRQKCF